MPVKSINQSAVICKNAFNSYYPLNNISCNTYDLIPGIMINSKTGNKLRAIVTGYFAY